MGDAANEDWRARIGADAPIYLLIDPLVAEPLAPAQVTGAASNAAAAVASARSRAWQRDTFAIPIDERTGLTLARHPYVVALRGTDDAWLDFWLTASRAQMQASWGEGLRSLGMVALSLGICLQSHLPGERLAQHLGRWMRLSTDAGTSARYLRLADPRALGLLTHVVGRETLAASVGSAVRWHFVDAFAQLDALGSAPAVVRAPDHDARPIHLTRKQWACMSEAGVLHPAIARYRGEILSDEASAERGADMHMHAHVHTDADTQRAPPYGPALEALRHARSASFAAIVGADLLRSDDDFSAGVALSLLHADWPQRAVTADILRRNAEASDPDRATLHTLAVPLRAALRDEASREPTTSNLNKPARHG